ncbi:MAG: DUF1553 domain-containing protein [Planctomycetota bacterium]|nr:MAG: DUF1553 domain-containing protein [Planctomycetota bacterium]
MNVLPKSFPVGTAVLALTVWGSLISALSGQEPSSSWEAAKPVLIARCLPCHGGQDRKGELLFSDAASFAQGGSRGPVLNRKRLEDSRLLEVVEYENPDLAMPPSGKLADQERLLLRKWILDGAPWPEGEAGRLADPERFAHHEEAVASANDWWAYQALQSETPPVSSNPDWNRNSVDAWIWHGLEQAGLQPAPQAKAESLLRRATFNLLGLPPTLEQRRTFLQEVEQKGFDAAWALLIERLLASPHYGEQWARHWLDQVRYAETNGYERDARKTNIWRYRDWVIRALNQDMPYDQFLIEQLAGDELFLLQQANGEAPAALDPRLATGFFRLGVWDDEPADRLQARADELADIVDTTGQVFLGTTLGCARCHDHKADPITQEDYYGFTAYFNNLSGYGGDDFGQHLGGGMTRPIADPATAGRLSQLAKERALAVLDAELKPYLEAFDEVLAQNDEPPAEILLADARSQAVRWRYRQEAADGWPMPGFDDRNWKEGHAGFGRRQTPGAVVRTDWHAGQLFMRTRFALTKIPRALILSLHHDEDVQVYLNGILVFERSGFRVDYGEWQLPQSAVDALVVGSNVLAISCRNQGGGQYIDAGLRSGWLAENLSARRIRLAQEGGRFLEPGVFDQARMLLQRREELERAPVMEAYPALVAFERGGQAPPQHVLLRGSAHAQGERVAPAIPAAFQVGIEVFQGPKVEKLPGEGHSTGRRLALARWLVEEGAYLTARVMANRIWQFHFGRGLCPSPGDFGRLGVKPTHPELLDHLALKLLSEGWSLKAMHRYLMTSQSYRMASVGSERAMAEDPNNRLYWRFEPRRLRAEEFRDAALAVSGSLNLSMFGPSVYPQLPEEVLATASRPEQAWGHSPESEAHRRSLYVFVKRSLRFPLLQSLDQPDPDISCPERFPTNIPTQALMTLNGGFCQDMAVRFAARLEQEGETEEGQIALALRLALGREPFAGEVDRHRGFLQTLNQDHGTSPQEALALFCLALLNQNEFLWLD